MLDKILSLSKGLIAIPSVTGSVEDAVKIIEFAKSQLPGFTYTPFVSNQLPSLLFSNRGQDVRKFKIILNAHLDTVSGTNEQYSPHEKDGRLYGRGAFDMKAAAAVEMLVFKELAHKLSFPLGLQLTTDEESGGMDGTNYQVQQGLRGEFIIIGECNSNFKVGNQSKGRQVIKITTKGKSAHSAYPWFGENAILRMYEVLAPILKNYPMAKKETYKTVVNITKIESSHNDTLTKIPDYCTAYLDIRYIAEDQDKIFSTIKTLLPEDVTLEHRPIRAYHFIDPQNPYILSLQNQTKAIRGEDLPLRFAHATSDAPHFTVVGCDAVEFGPLGEGAHHDNEWVDMHSLEDYYHILKDFLLEIDQRMTQSDIQDRQLATPSLSPIFVENINQE